LAPGVALPAKNPNSANLKARLNLQLKIGRFPFLGIVLTIWLICCPKSAFSQSAPPAAGTNEIRIVELQNLVEVSPAGAKTWVLTQTNQLLHPGDRLRTGPNSRVALRWADESVVPFGASTELEVLPPDAKDSQPGLFLVRGILSFFHRDKPGHIRAMTLGALAGIEGTEFVLAVDDADRTTISVIDGKVRFGNSQATLVLTNGEQASAQVGQAPVRTPGFIANNVLQWCFYYPAVLDPADLPLSADEQNALTESLTAYRSGDLLAALSKYPTNRQPGSAAERVYYAALLLSVGEVEKTETNLNSLGSIDTSTAPARAAAALRELIAAVKQTPNTAPAPQLTTEFLADSYYQQSRGDRKTSLSLALQSARQAAAKSPQFGFAWERVAELEFSFGHTTAAAEALQKSLDLAPRNAQAIALQGFILAAQDHNREALAAFDHALAIDSALGNAWLGRGLCRIHLGDNQGGRQDLMVAAALEPQRAELRSYLGKAYSNVGDFSHATRELDLAEKLDPNDPTAFLYSAVINQENNRVNEAIRDLEKSEALNNNRSVYRSQLLLDQDEAVRSANLAGMYRDAGMQEVAQREAARAVNYDYGNYASHLFLANSYFQLSDPNLTNLRYETPTESEFLLANLLAPVGAGPLSPSISQQEYSRLFDQNHVGVVSDTEYLSRGAWAESGTQYGTFDKFNYGFSGVYRHDPGQRFNEDLEERSLSFNLKAQITPKDSAYFLLDYNKTSGGDLSQFYDPHMATNGNPRFDERQEPILALGYHHEWAPGIHTLLLGTRLSDKYSLTNDAQPSILLVMPDAGGVPTIGGVHTFTAQQLYQSKLEIYSGEVQQIFQLSQHTTILGGRAQYGNIQTENIQGYTTLPNFFDTSPHRDATNQNSSSIFRRFSLYGYHQWEITDWMELIGGVSYDRITFPEVFRTVPVTGTQKTVDGVSPKAGLILRPLSDTTVRFAYTRSLGGASIDQSFQLEPSQIAGFVQSFRSIIPESVMGATAGAKFETYGLSLEQKLPTRTYLGVSGEILNSKFNQSVGAFEFFSDEEDFPHVAALRQRLDYREPSLQVTANQLIGNEWSFGARYRLSQAVLKDDYPFVPTDLPAIAYDNFVPRQRQEAILNQVTLSGIFNSPCGFFAEGNADWYSQDNRGSLPNDHFWQLNAFAGYRFPRRRAAITLGILNLTDQNYKLNPLNIYNELPRSRTLLARFQINF
jgi:tetratricopeptide (TPR) repeat protein